VSDSGPQVSSMDAGPTWSIVAHDFNFADLLLGVELRYAASSGYGIAGSMPAIPSVRTISLSADASGPVVDGAQISNALASQTSLQHVATSTVSSQSVMTGAQTSNTLALPASLQPVATSTLSNQSVMTGAQTPDAFPVHASLHDITIADMQPHGIVGIIPHVAASAA
jgi:hypothetical protein